MGKMNINLCGIELDNPVMAASGTFGYGYEFAELYDIKLGTKSFKGAFSDQYLEHKKVSFADLDDAQN